MPQVDLTPLQGGVTTTSKLNVRTGLPSRQAPIARKVEPGTYLTVRGLAAGDVVSGNGSWYAGDEDSYFWSGACTSFQPGSSAAAAAVVSRRTDGTILPLSNSQIESVFGRFKYKEGLKGRIEIEKAWIAANIVSLPTPLLAGEGFASIDVHVKARDCFERVFAAIEAAGLGDRILTCGGTFVPRHKGWNPKRSLSSHSWGIAIDLNVAWNGYGSAPAKLGMQGSVRELVSLFEAEGCAWGGYFSPPYQDGMHFELARTDV